jgi:hypothetical protein
MLFAADTAMAQDCFGVELFVDGSSATQELGNVDLETGVGFEANLTYRFLPHPSVHAGWSWQTGASGAIPHGAK